MPKLGPFQANQEAVPIRHLPAGIAVSGCCRDQLKPAALGADIPGSSGTSDSGGSVLHGVSQVCSALSRGGQECHPCSCLRGGPAEQRLGKWTVPAGGRPPRVSPQNVVADVLCSSPWLGSLLGASPGPEGPSIWRGRLASCLFGFPFSWTSSAGPLSIF